MPDPERDYFDFPDEDTPPAPTAPILHSHQASAVTDQENYDYATLPTKHRQAPKTVFAVLVFLIVLAGCFYMVFQQIQQDHKPKHKKPATAQSVTK